MFFDYVKVAANLLRILDEGNTAQFREVTDTPSHINISRKQSQAKPISQTFTEYLNSIGKMLPHFRLTQSDKNALK